MFSHFRGKKKMSWGLGLVNVEDMIEKRMLSNLGEEALYKYCVTRQPKLDTSRGKWGMAKAIYEYKKIKDDKSMIDLKNLERLSKKRTNPDSSSVPYKRWEEIQMEERKLKEEKMLMAQSCIYDLKEMARELKRLRESGEEVEVLLKKIEDCRIFLRQIVSQALPDQLLCKLCFDKKISRVSVICGHTWCSACEEVWFKKKNSCPICRKVDVKTIDLFL